MKFKFVTIFLVGAFIFFAGCQSDIPTKPAEKPMLVDDFNTLDEYSPLGTKWEQFTDQVMGGVSTAEHSFKNVDGKNCIHLTGDVSLENKGGFIMVSLELEPNGKKVNLAGYKGVRVTAKGEKGNYFIQLRTSENWFPWQFYMAKLEVDDKWQTIEIPFKNFIPENTSKKINVSKTKKLAILAYKKAFKANIAVAKIEFYIEN